MSPSLREKFDQMNIGDGLADLEDMSYTHLRLRPDLSGNLYRLRGQMVSTDIIGSQSTRHQVTVISTGETLILSNDEDVYE